MGRWDEVEKKIKFLESKILLGHLEYDKLMHPNKYKASYRELSSWLQTYTDFPVVMQKRVYKLMVKRNSHKNYNNGLQKPKYGNYLRGYGENKRHYSSYLKLKNPKQL